MNTLSYTKEQYNKTALDSMNRQQSFQVSTDIMKERYVTSEHARRESLASIRGITEVKETPFKFTSK